MSSVWLPEHLQALKPYEPGKPVEEVQRELGLPRVVKMASNENAFGPSPRAVAAAQEAARRLQWYPDGGAFYLRRALAEYHRVPMDHIAVGAGSTELVQLLVYGLLTPRDHALVADATFLMYQLALRVMRIPFTAVPLRSYTYDLEVFLDAVRPETKMVFLANPNNPTGSYFPADAFAAFLDRLPERVLVVYDEAYIHYVDRADFPSGLDFYRRDPRVVVLRTFSKAYGLAGLRVGYAIARPEILRALQIVRSPFNTSSIAQATALAALEDEDHMRTTVTATLRERKRLYAALREQGWNVLPSVTNFFCVLVQQDPYDLFQTLLRRGIIVRPLPPFGVPNGVRITVGTPEDNDYFLGQIKEMPPV